MSTDTKALATLDTSYLKDNANVGLEDISAEDLPTPTLNVIQNNSTLVDDDGRPFPRGQFVYKGDNRLMKEVNCTFLSVSKTEFPDFNDKTQMVKTFVMMGVFEEDQKPFILYMKKTNTAAVRNFLGKIKFSGAPMFAHKVKLTTEEVKSPRGSYYVINITVAGLHDSMDKVVMYEDLAKTYGTRVRDQVQETNPAHAAPDYPDAPPADGEEVSPDDIPF